MERTAALVSVRESNQTEFSQSTVCAFGWSTSYFKISILCMYSEFLYLLQNLVVVCAHGCALGGLNSATATTTQEVTAEGRGRGRKLRYCCCCCCCCRLSYTTYGYSVLSTHTYSSNESPSQPHQLEQQFSLGDQQQHCTNQNFTYLSKTLHVLLFFLRAAVAPSCFVWLTRAHTTVKTVQCSTRSTTGVDKKLNYSPFYYLLLLLLLLLFPFHKLPYNVGTVQ